MKFVLLLSLAIISLAQAQKPAPCSTPAQWEGSVYETNDKKNYRLEGSISYDGNSRRQRFLWKETSNGVVSQYDRLFLEKQNVLYQFNVLTKSCDKIQGFTWKDYGVPSGSNFYGSSYIGSSAIPNGSIITNVWGKNFTDTQGNRIEFIGIWTDTGCVPVRSIVSGDQFGIARSNFYDITPGIKDPSVFTPHPECL